MDFALSIVMKSKQTNNIFQQLEEFRTVSHCLTDASEGIKNAREKAIELKGLNDEIKTKSKKLENKLSRLHDILK